MTAPGDPPPAHRVALVGLPGSGKSRVGRLLAESLGAPFLDTDALVESGSASTIAEIFRGEGESAFRDLEQAVLAEAAQVPPPLVLATGGGIVERPENRNLLADSFFVVWLQVGLEIALARLGDASDRPLLAEGDVREGLNALASRRDPLYRQIAQHTLKIDAGTTAEGAAAAIRRVLSGAPA